MNYTKLKTEIRKKQKKYNMLEKRCDKLEEMQNKIGEQQNKLRKVMDEQARDFAIDNAPIKVGAIYRMKDGRTFTITGASLSEYDVQRRRTIKGLIDKIDYEGQEQGEKKTFYTGHTIRERLKKGVIKKLKDQKVYGIRNIPIIRVVEIVEKKRKRYLLVSNNKRAYKCSSYYNNSINNLIAAVSPDKPVKMSCSSRGNWALDGSSIESVELIEDDQEIVIYLL